MAQKKKSNQKGTCSTLWKTALWFGVAIGAADVLCILLFLTRFQVPAVLWADMILVPVLIAVFLLAAAGIVRKTDRRLLSRVNGLANDAGDVLLGGNGEPDATDIGSAFDRLDSVLSQTGDRIRRQTEFAKGITDGGVCANLNLLPAQDELSGCLNEVAEGFCRMQADIEQMTRLQNEGDTDVFLPVETYTGKYAIVMRGVNDMVKSHLDIMQKTTACIGEFAKGNFEAELEQFPGKKAVLNTYIEQFRANIQIFIFEMNRMARLQDEGDLDAFIDDGGFEGDFAVMARGVNSMVKSHIAVKKKAMACVAEFSKGNFDAELEQFPGKKAFVNDTIEHFRTNIKKLISEMNEMSRQHDAGDIDVFMPVDQFEGDFATMAAGVNKMVQGHISVKKKAMACVAEFAKGDFEVELERFPGKKAFINDNIEALRKNLKDVNAEISELIFASKEGQLDQRADAQAFSGDWGEMIQGLNHLIDALINPVMEAADVLKKMEGGDLTVEVKGDYKGDHARIKNALNATIRSFNELLSNINNSAQEVGAGSRQVAESSQALSQGATEQASAVEELTSSIAAVAEQTKRNAETAAQASQLAVTAQKNASSGSEKMQNMLLAMNDISASSDNISKIIKVIDSIAFQTNILALNAAVEAARAGQYGKGFAVVAEEVRNLAAKSAEAAKETASLIENSISKVKNGTQFANETSEMFTKITMGVHETSALIDHIATSSNEQATAIAQIDKGVSQVSVVVQTNSATAQEGAASSEELSGQADMLAQMIDRFRLKAV